MQKLLLKKDDSRGENILTELLYHKIMIINSNS